MGQASSMSRPLPCGTPSRMSRTTTSASSLSAMLLAAVAPTLPDPIDADFSIHDAFSTPFTAGRPATDAARLPCHAPGIAPWRENSIFTENLWNPGGIAPMAVREPPAIGAVDPVVGESPRAAAYYTAVHFPSRPAAHGGPGPAARGDAAGLAQGPPAVRRRPRRHRSDPEIHPNFSRSEHRMKIVIADPLPPSAADLLREQGWTVDAESGRPRPRSSRRTSPMPTP